MSNFMFNFISNNQNEPPIKNRNTYIQQSKKSTLKIHDENANINKARAWGILTWMLFHTLAEKIKVEKFQYYSKFIISYIKRICYCLPCPYCREDAKLYLSSFNFKLIKSKEDLILFLFDFHNHVNKKLKNETPDVNILEKYRNLDIINVLNLWYQYFTRFGIESQEFMEGMERDKVRNDFYKFITTNRVIFN